MEKILLPVDGSESSDHAVREIVRLIQNGHPMELELLNAQCPVTGDVSLFVSGGDLQGYHHDNGLKALQSARDALDQAGIPYRHHIVTGRPGDCIAQFAQEAGCDRIVMGSRKLGRLAGILLGAVASEVVHRAEIPVEILPKPAT